MLIILEKYPKSVFDNYFVFSKLDSLFVTYINSKLCSEMYRTTAQQSIRP